MPDPRAPVPSTHGLLPDGPHCSAGPGTALLRLATTHAREGILDGAWWPRSHDIGAELPSLITALTEHLGPVARVGVDACAWDAPPTRLVVDGRTVHIDAFAVGDGTVLVTRGDRDYFSLLVVPPSASPEVARAAMARAVSADNAAGAEQILIDIAGAPGPPVPPAGP
ncbi:DUF5994 family protein [Streptomyces sp. NPDC046831]|uniref:DUF5994 family protein n=1 Tax=Streptomyces sp. NPDC046831 TaxID=3154805 RepID=UPI00340B5D3D